MRALPILVSMALVLGTATVAQNGPKVVEGVNFAWQFDGKKSEKASQGKDDPGRLHITVKKGDHVRFVAKTGFHGVVFENGKDETEKGVWSRVGTTPTLQPLDAARKAFYSTTPDNALMTPGAGAGQTIIEIEVGDLSPDEPILFACQVHTHLPGAAMRDTMYGAIVVEVPDAPAPKKIEGVTGNKWEPLETTVKVGDIVEWSVKNGFHGVMFNDWDKAMQVLEPLDGGLPIEPQDGFPAPAQGTEGKGVGTVLVRAKIKAVPADMTEVAFFCSVHGTGMAGKLKLQADTPVPEKKDGAPYKSKP